MRVTKLMGLAVVLVAMAAVMNALAFNSATVTNSFSITVDSTTAAQLSLSGASGGTGYSSSVANGKLSVSITDKVQPDSIYLFGPVFTVKNNDTVSHSLSYSSSISDPTVTLVQSDGTTAIGATALTAGASRDVYIKVATSSSFFSGAAASTPVNGTISITGN